MNWSRVLGNLLQLFGVSRNHPHHPTNVPFEPVEILPPPTVAPPVPPIPHTGESQRVRVGGAVFRRADGSIFPWRGASDFALFGRFCEGEDLTDLLSERIRAGANVLRVFAMFDRFGIGHASGLGELTPRRYADYYARVRAFTATLADVGLFVEWVYCADGDPRSDGSGGLLPTRDAVQAHLDAMDEAVAGCWNVFREGANEPFKNLRDIHLYRFRRDGAMGPLAYGHGIVERGDRRLPHADYVTVHDHERKPEWPRTCRGYDEIRRGGSWELTDEERAAHPEWAEAFEGVHCPVVADEPMGFDEVEIPGRRVTNVDDAAAFAAGCALFCAGATFHSTDGVASRPWRPRQASAARIWFDAAQVIDPRAQQAEYQRGGRGGGPGIGNMPVEHHDLEEGVTPAALRTFAKRVDGTEYVVRIRPVGATVPRDGWRIVAEPRLGIVVLQRG